VEDCNNRLHGGQRRLYSSSSWAPRGPLPVTHVFGSPESDTTGAGCQLSCSLSAAPVDANALATGLVANTFLCNLHRCCPVFFYCWWWCVVLLKRHSRIVRRPGRTCKHVRAPRWALFERDEAMGEATGSYASADYERG
jgi:hypothetical protein